VQWYRDTNRFSMPNVTRSIQEIDEIASLLEGRAQIQTLAQIQHRGQSYPIRALIFGKNPDPSQPVMALFGGVHGLERIGAEVVLAYLKTFSALASWDKATQAMLENMRVAFVPIINPVGIETSTRSNGNGVDLMRNAPIDSLVPEPAWKIFRGHRISSHLPWYRGKAEMPMEQENQALVDFVQREIFPSRFSICVDVHSGFGAVDRLWYPYATRTEPYPDTQTVLRLKGLLDRTLPNHVYVVEPQSRQYTTHGDVWDYLYELHQKSRAPDSLFVPLTLEMGSWNWLKKNFFRSLQIDALFHPIKQHRIRRVLRRHSGLFDFLTRAAFNHPLWNMERDMHRLRKR
jgi:hypothetical protein